MALTNYSDLTTAVANWLYGRTDLTSRIPEFIAMAEAKFQRRLECREMEQRSTATTTIGEEHITLPSDFIEMRYVRLEGTYGWKRLRFATAAQMADMRERLDDQTGEPVWFTVIGTQMELCPTPSAEYDLEMNYRKKIPGLQANTTNWLMTLAPDVYLHGTLVEASPYIYDDERIPVWKLALEEGIAELNMMSQRALYNAGPLVVRTNRSSYS